jgi:hypothetical protein
MNCLGTSRLPIGDFKTSHWRLPPVNLSDTPVFHPHKPYPSPAAGPTIINEADSVKYCDHSLLLPMFSILENEYPFLKFYPKAEVTLVTEVIVDDNDTGYSDSKTVIRAAARVDVIVEVERLLPFPEKEIVLLLEHKAPGTLRRSDWIDGLYTGTRHLVFNAEIIAQQSRKYMCAAIFHMIGIIDCNGLVGMCVRNEDQDLWASDETLEVKLFFEHRPDRFLLSLLAMTLIGLRGR